ncbi:unnamed protein product, partial [Medioppia subpectinata]
IIGCSAGDPTAGDGLPIRDIVDMFSERRCRALRGKPKLFIYNCCREKGVDTAQVPADTSVTAGAVRCRKCEGQLTCAKCESTRIDTMTSLDGDWKNMNKQTHVIYACAQGLKTWYHKVDGPIGHVSVFGQALSHTIAQYSWYKSLYQLFLMSVKRLEDELKAYRKKHLPFVSEEIIDRRPEINMFAVNKELSIQDID